MGPDHEGVVDATPPQSGRKMLFRQECTLQEVHE